MDKKELIEIYEQVTELICDYIANGQETNEPMDQQFKRIAEEIIRHELDLKNITYDDEMISKIMKELLEVKQEQIRLYIAQQDMMRRRLDMPRERGEDEQI